MARRRRGRGSLVPLLLVLCSTLARDIAASVTTTALALTIVRDPREYCAAEEFVPRCLPNEVALITDAHYGRMQVGDCVKTDYGYIGCSADVIDILDDECSGKRSCTVRIPNTRLESVNQCPKEFKAYLNVSYECIPVQEAACGGCISMTKTRVAKVTQPKGFLASIVTLESKSGVCGSAQCPWVIEVESGQTINLTLYDFSNTSLMSSGSYPGQCIRLAVIKEEAHLKESPICYRHSRIQTVYSSVSHSVQIHVVSHEVLRTKGRFLIEYEAVGCPDLHAPENAWLERHGDLVVVGCHDASLGVRWESRCVDTKWQGVIGTCPGILAQPTAAPGILTLPLGVLVAIVLGIALVIGVLIVTVGIICLKRQQNEMLARTGRVLYVPAGQCYELREDYASGGGHSSTSVRKPTSQGPEHPTTSKEHHLLAGRRNVYAHTRMDTRPLPSLPNLSEASSGGACRVGSPCRGGGGGGGGCPGPSDLCPYHPHMTATLGRTSQKAMVKTGCGAPSGAGSSGSSGGRRKASEGCGFAAGSGSPARVPAPSCSFAGGGGPACSSHPPAPPPPPPNLPSVPCASPLSAAAIPQHYTVLDPIEVQQQQLLGTTLPSHPTPSSLGQQSAAASAAATDGAPSGGGGGGAGPSAAASSSSSSSGPPKPPLPLASGSGSGQGSRPVNEGIEKSQCREITLRPTRQNSARSKSNDNDASGSGNSSWP